VAEEGEAVRFQWWGGFREDRRFGWLAGLVAVVVVGRLVWLAVGLLW
jgi:hypothetical protein